MSFLAYKSKNELNVNLKRTTTAFYYILFSRYLPPFYLILKKLIYPLGTKEELRKWSNETFIELEWSGVNFGPF